ncbi:class I SAM-dependent methyltransferase [Niveibacterium sp. SC-1]|uniref:class I SAM-dependent methyltransferase n=1 Tax=Niveibacterium sp. SC-1 TaxID=3135646 RepID=UPI00311FFA73
MSQPTRHLDLGCGAHPRNPYRASAVFGVDIRLPAELRSASLVEADIVLDGIPFPDNHFDSVSAFDFLEHVPRQAFSPRTGRTIFPFVDLMSEVWRVLKPDGLFYGFTPAFPHAAAFQDPTHVNIITVGTHDYFCGGAPAAAVYGFKGRFVSERVCWTCAKNAEDARDSLRKRLRDLHRRHLRRKVDHLLWELRADKGSAGQS